MYNAVNCAETTIRYVVFFTNSTLFYHDDHFDSMAFFDVSLRESTCTFAGRVEIMHTTCCP